LAILPGWRISARLSVAVWNERMKVKHFFSRGWGLPIATPTRTKVSRDIKVAITKLEKKARRIRGSGKPPLAEELRNKGLEEQGRDLWIHKKDREAAFLSVAS
jgi:hypothetical protein